VVLYREAKGIAYRDNKRLFKGFGAPEVASTILPLLAPTGPIAPQSVIQIFWATPSGVEIRRRLSVAETIREPPLIVRRSAVLRDIYEVEKLVAIHPNIHQPEPTIKVGL
jgi:hypothetical protein